MLLDIGFDDVVVWPRRGGRLGSVLDVCRVETLAAVNARWKRRYCAGLGCPGCVWGG